MNFLCSLTQPIPQRIWNKEEQKRRKICLNVFGIMLETNEDWNNDDEVFKWQSLGGWDGRIGFLGLENRFLQGGSN